MTRILAIVLPLLILVGLGFGGVALLGALAPEPEEAEEGPPGLAVFAEAIVEDDLRLTVTAQGEVRPKREILISPQISGRISYVSPDFVDGGFIRRGQTLVRLEAADYELSVRRGRSVVASAEQRLAREQAEAEIAIQDLEDLGVTDASPLARREPQLAEAQASLDSANAQLAEAELALSRTAVVAPFSGRVSEQSADLGQFISPGQSLGGIFSTDVVEVALPITDRELGRLNLPLAFAETADAPGPDVVFEADVGGEPRRWTGRVVRSAAALDPRTRLITVIAELEDPYGEGSDRGAPMAPGLFVNATIQGEVIPAVKVAPREALRGDNEVYIGDPKAGTLEIRIVDVIFTDTYGAYLDGGVERGELAIVSPIQAAFDGMSVRVLERMPDGSVVTHEPEGTGDDAETPDGGATADLGGNGEGVSQ
ncbi:MAG: efflux RND transporter periplasmic adaptor subunit [Pseudomonadota bacterium]